jgi:hypothetical protein
MELSGPMAVFCSSGTPTGGGFAQSALGRGGGGRGGGRLIFFALITLLKKKLNNNSIKRIRITYDRFGEG